jgi:DNA-binding beta-propeller fold protein YncE
MGINDERLKRALSGPTVPIDRASMERDLHVVVHRGRRRRRNRRVAMLSVGVAILVLGAALVPPALEFLRSVGETRPATPAEPRGLITTVVGTGVARSSGDGGLAREAAIRYPFDLVVDTAGNLFVLESGRVRRVDRSGRITTVVGPPATHETAALTEANQLHLGRTVNALAIDAEDNLYVGGGDGEHFVVTRISPSGEATRIAGTGRPGFSGDGEPAIEAELGWVYDLAVDPAGNVYIVDHDNHRIRMVDTDGVITTIAGTGAPGWSGDGGPATDARLDSPWGIAVDEGGNVYFTQLPSVARRIDAASGVITTIAGSGKVGYAGDGGLATDARMNSPEHIAVDAQGYLFIEDTGNHCIRMVDLKGIITTIVGMRSSGFRGDGGPARLARLSQPSGMLLTPDRVLFIADSGNNRVRRVIL